MRAGDNASASAHAGPLNSRERLATHGAASLPSMMMTADVPNGVPKHRPGPGYPVNRSFNAEKCRHEGCTTMRQSGLFCRQHAQSSATDPHGIRKPSMTRNVPIVPSQPRPVSFNGIHSFQRHDAQPRADSSPSNSKKVLPEKLVARKSSSSMPTMPTRTESPSLYANNTSQLNDSRPQKRQRVSGSYDNPDSSQSGRPRFSSELQGYIDGGRPRQSQGSPFHPNLNIAPSRPQPAVHHHPNGLHSPVTTGASPAASPACGSPLLQSRPPPHGLRASPPGARPPISARPLDGHSGLSNGVNVSPNQRATDQRALDRAQQPPISREYRLGSNGVTSPDIPQDKSGAALALYEKHRRDNMSHAELKARMQDAKLCPNPQSLGPEVMMRLPGSQNSGTRDRVTPDIATHSRHEQQQLRAAPARSSNWRPPVPSMSSFHGWPHGPAAIDLTRSSNSPIELSGSRPQSSGNTQPSLSQIKVSTVTSAPSPNISTTSVDPEALPGKDVAGPPLQESDASPKSALITNEHPEAPIDLTLTKPLSRPTSRHKKTPLKQQNTAQRQGFPDKVEVGKSFRQAEGPRYNTTTESNVPQFPHKSDAERKQRIQKQLEAAKRAEDALRRGVALMPSDSDANIRSSNHSDHLHKDKVNGVLPNSTTSSDSGIALLSPTTAEIFRLKEVPEPERRRLELVGKHDPARLDGFIYGELNEPCRPMSRLFGMLPEERPPQKTKPAQHFAHIDPRVHWAKPRSTQWHDDMRTNMQTRGNRKRVFGKAAARQTQRKRDLPMEPPERVTADPKWLAALKVLDGMAAKHLADEKAKVAGEEADKAGTLVAGPIKETDVVVMSGDAASNRRSVRHNSRQTNGVKSANTTPRRVLRTKNSSRRLHATVEDADESEDEDDEHSAYGASGGRKTDVDRMEIDTTPTRRRR